MGASRATSDGEAVLREREVRRIAPSRAQRLSGRRWHLPAVPVAIAALVALSLRTLPAGAVVLSQDELADTGTEVGLVAKSFGFVLAGPTLAPPYSPEDADPSALNVEDLRTYFSYRGTHLRLVWHESTTSTVRSDALLGPLSLGRGATPPRFLPLRADFASEPTLSLATEADWAYAAWAQGPVTVTIGRQPVTLGRGRLFRPWDLVSTFALTQVDTEYKPGVDAARVSISPATGTTVDLVAAIGERRPHHDFSSESRGSSFVLTAAQTFDRGEFSGIVGLVRNDVVAGWGALWSFPSLDLYGEVTATWLRSDSLGSPAVVGRKAAVPRALVGLSARPASHLTFIPEIYYDGFGARGSDGYLSVLASERVAVGEQITLGRLYAAAALDWEADPLVHVTGLVLSNALDPSGLVSVSVSYDAAANTRLVAGVYVPAGRLPESSPVLAPRSEFGLYPDFGFLEARIAL